VTAHHLRRHGEPKNDRRTLPLCASSHIYEMGVNSIERIGKRKFEQFFELDLEALVLKHNERYEQERRA